MIMVGVVVREDDKLQHPILSPQVHTTSLLEQVRKGQPQVP
jgi:hypothetical protein